MEITNVVYLDQYLTKSGQKMKVAAKQLTVCLSTKIRIVGNLNNYLTIYYWIVQEDLDLQEMEMAKRVMTVETRLYKNHTSHPHWGNPPESLL